MSTSHIFTELDFTEDFEIRQGAVAELERRILNAPIDLRQSLESYNGQADSFQQKVIDASDTTIRVIAPAGSGKTQTVINRVISRVKKGTSPDRVLIVTFDNSAASALTNFLQKVQIRLPGLRISTLNAFGYWILRQYVPSEFKSIIPDYRSRRLFREVKEALKAKSMERYAALPGNLKNSFFIDFFSLLKNELFDPRDLHPQRLADFLIESKQAEPFFSITRDQVAIKLIIQAIAWLYTAYDVSMQREKLIDFDDQKLRPYQCLAKTPALCGVVQNLYTEIIVDEFQDINRLDFEFMKLVAAKASLMVTGDDDQAIYGFRGCTPDYIIDLEKHLRKEITSFELQINYRCPRNIVKHADQLIRHNKRRIEKRPLSNNQSDSEIKVMSTLSGGIEARSIVSLIKRITTANPTVGYQDIAILYRTNAQSLPLQVEFILKHIPYYVRDEDNILSNQILDKLLGTLRLKMALQDGRSPGEDDGVSAVKAYFQYVNPSDESRLKQLFNSCGDYLKCISSRSFLDAFPKAGKSNFLIGIQELVKARSLMQCLDVLGRRFRGLEGMIGSLEDVIQEKVPLGEVFELAANFGGSISEFIKMMEDALHLAKSTNAGKDNESGVKMLTYFKSKGLQWHTVILTSCNEGLIPHSKAPIEEERRLFYVAMTRASSNLVLSYVKSLCRNKVAPSRFFYEAGLLEK